MRRAPPGCVTRGYKPSIPSRGSSRRLPAARCDNEPPILQAGLPMKIAAAIAAFLTAAVAFTAAAQADAERVKAELKKKVPEAQVDAIRKIPYGGLYEVVVGGEIFYTDANASFIVM